ncbi:hypothetical protein I9H06_17560 [Pseudomonas tremae]|uniref:hypothetical protein n=1 Tax=Pseudomonas tremae TaxID=200454 RepID=UPI001F222D4C|nr:hypothetical protein [Pseudomonas tremae]MCF5716036.1 hypothetical protein [Pseudomonas tremae]UQB30157.1 hypothetical protein I9H06_17560 [Pseudomonas tremae]
MDAKVAVEGIRSQGYARVVTFLGFAGAGYEYPDQVEKILLSELENFDPTDTIVCAGATAEGIGMVYRLAAMKGFRTVGVVSSIAREQGVKFSAECEGVFVVNDDTWGGRRADGRLSPTSQAMVDTSDVMIGIGGGSIAKDELEEGLRTDKTIRFYKADMDHARAKLKAAKAGKPVPVHFDGAAQTLFKESCR